MSYDFYCYRPTSGAPDATEARAVIASEEGHVYRDDEEARAIKKKIAEALVAYNPRLEIFKIDHHEVAKMMKISLEQARSQWNHIELNPPEGDLAIQAWIHWDCVSFEIPYWYTGTEADKVFRQLGAYSRVIRKTVGFFTYDPQTDRAFDPEREDFADHSEYDRIAENLRAIIAQGTSKKPWWKFW